MRALLVVLLLAAAAPAFDADLVRALVEQLGSVNCGERQRAQARLANYGEEIIPMLREMRSADPEVVRHLRELTRAARRLRLELAGPGAPVPLGGPLVFELRLVNDTEDTHMLPLVHASERGAGTLSTIFIGGTEPRFLLPTQVEWIDGEGPQPVLRPGDIARLRITLTGEDSPLRRPGRATLRFGYQSLVAQWPGLTERESYGETTEFMVRLEAELRNVEAVARTPAELETALASEDARTRVMAEAELAVREDDAVLPVLRRHVGDRGLREVAIRRLGALAAEEDFDAIYEAARDRDAKVRLEAVRALANYQGSRARAKLINLAQDHELSAEAIRALRRHKHPSTIDLYVRLLRQGLVEQASADEMCATIFEWTKMPLTNHLGEIQRFERWWMANRERWTRENLQR